MQTDDRNDRQPELDAEVQTRENVVRHGMSWETSKAIEVLKQGRPGDELTRLELEEILKCPVQCSPVQTKGYAAVNRAIRHVINNYRVTWAWKRELQLYQCLTAVERSNELTRYKRRARSAVKRGIRVAETVDVSKLTREEKTRHEAELFLAHCMEKTASPAASNRAEKLIERTGSGFPKPTLDSVFRSLARKRPRPDTQPDTQPDNPT